MKRAICTFLMGASHNQENLIYGLPHQYLMEILIAARGHKNVLAFHRTTIEITKDTHLTPAGDCIVAVGSDKGFTDFSSEEKARLQSSDITVTFSCEGDEWSVSGRGDPSLAMTHPTEMVMRKSLFCCPRTLLIGADKAACDMPREMVEKLQDPSAEVSISIRVTSPHGSTHAHQNNRSENPQDSAQDAGQA